MFTGIVQTIGVIQGIRAPTDSRVLTIRAKLGGGSIRLGESIAINGVCLTVEQSMSSGFRVRAAAETLRRTTLGDLKKGMAVNLERSLRPTDRIGGHFVFGHVDAIARLRSVKPEGDSRLYRFMAPRHVFRYLVEKGSVALNGVSLTVFGCTSQSFTVCIIPHTLSHTNLGKLRPGARLNLETDMLARYVERLGEVRAGASRSRRVGKSARRAGSSR